jgi:sulfur carrier protein ThiS
MDVEVPLFATLREGRFRRKTLHVPAGSTVGDVCQQLAIGPGEAAILMVNGSAALRDHALKSGDEVSLFPAIGGG